MPGSDNTVARNEKRRQIDAFDKEVDLEAAKTIGPEETTESDPTDTTEPGWGENTEAVECQTGMAWADIVSLEKAADEVKYLQATSKQLQLRCAQLENTNVKCMQRKKQAEAVNIRIDEDDFK